MSTTQPQPDTPAENADYMKVPQFRSFVDKSDYAEIEPVFENNYIAEGPFAKQFSEKLLEITGSSYGCFASNGTLALYLAMRALDIGPGDEVFVQNSTFIASANGIEMTGAMPVFVDVVSHSDLTIDLNKVKLTPKSKAMVVAPLFGTANSNIREIQQFCLDNGLLLIEDAAQALAITDGIKHCGTYGDVGTFSFYADKTITTAEGGYIVTDREDVYEKMRYLRNQGRKQSGTFLHPEIGYNFRITDMQAALGLAQLKKLDRIKQEKAKIYSLYQKHIGDAVEYLKLVDGYNHIPFRVVVFVDDADKSVKYMAEKGIEPRSVFYPLHKQPCYEHLGYSDEGFEQSIACYDKGICLPTWIGLTEKQIAWTSKALIESIS